MSKIIFAVFSLLITFLIFIVNTTPTFALEKCLMGTDPTPLTNETPKAKFIVSVANLGGADSFNDWKIEFKCGAPNKKCGLGEPCSVVKDKPDKIYTEVENSAFLLNQCIFAAGSHGLVVSGVRSDGTEVGQCEAIYSVLDTKTLCKLSISPETGITSNTSLTVSGTNLKSGGRFAIFIDNQVTGSGFVKTPSFSGFTIPAKYLTPGPHVVDLRELKGGPSPTFGSSLCSLAFTVGTDANPGSVSAPGPAGIINWIPGIAAKAPPCNNDPKDPGIQTAIGCIHTSPAGFVKDFLKFIIGIAGGLAFLMMILGAFQMLTSAGNPETLAAGKDRLQSAIIGLLFVIFAVLLLRIIGVDILGLGEQFGFK